MPVLLLIGIPIAVAVLFIGIMSLPDEEVKKSEIDPHASVKKVEKKKKRK